MDRNQYLQWSKDRALQYLNTGDLTNAVASIISDLNQRGYDDTKINFYLANAGLISAMHDDPVGVKRFIDGFR